MKDKPMNPLEPLKSVGLSKDEQMEMLTRLRSIMEEEERAASQSGSLKPASSAQHRKSTSAPVWARTSMAGVAAVIVAVGVLFGIQHHVSTSRTVASHNQHPSTSNLKLPASSGTMQQATMAEANTNGSTLSQLHAGALHAAGFVSSRVGFIAGEDGIYKTVDGGQLWTKVYSSTHPIIGLTANTEQVQGSQYTWVTAWTKTKMVASYHNGDKWSVVQTNLANMGVIQDVSQLPNAQFLFVMNGAVWAADGEGSGWFKRTPPEPVTSVANVGINTFYAAATSGAVYKTTDAGKNWSKVFSAPLTHGSHWKTEVQATGNHVAVYDYGGDAAMSQQAFAMYTSKDAGATWTALFDEAYFPDYGSAAPITKAQLSLQPGPFALLSNGDVVFAGVDPKMTDLTTLSVILPTGKRTAYTPVGPSGNTPNVFGRSEMPAAISAPDRDHIFVVGAKGGTAVVEESSDGGATWHSP